MKAVFVAGTDTGVGKTVVCGLLARYLKNKNYRVVPQKWIQTGSKDFPLDIAGQLSLMKMKKSQVKDIMQYVCPYSFKFPCSPHLAASLEKTNINAGKIKSAFKVLSEKFDFVIVEGIGGALVPFNRKQLVIDIAKQLNLPAIIVVGNKLGAINHTLMTIEAIRARKVPIAGIIFNNLSTKQDKLILRDNIEIIRILSREKILGSLAYSKNKDSLYKSFLPVARTIEKWISG